MPCSSSDKRETAISAIASSRPLPIQLWRERGLGLDCSVYWPRQLFIDLTGGPAPPDAEGVGSTNGGRARRRSFVDPSAPRAKNWVRFAVNTILRVVDAS